MEWIEFSIFLIYCLLFVQAYLLYLLAKGLKQIQDITINEMEVEIVKLQNKLNRSSVHV